MRLLDPRTGRVAVALGGLLVAFAPGQARAFCQATTCDPKSEKCERSGSCVTSGAPLHWVSRCLSFATQKDGSPLRHIPYATADGIVQQAFQQWMRADCGGGKRPSFELFDLGQPYGGMVCDQPEFNELKPNANVWMFRDDRWPYEGTHNVLALTSTLFDKASGALLDADVEINSFGTEDLTTTSAAGRIGKDLASIVTHEAGHFLGLAHSEVKGATMSADYVPGDLNYRSLQVDDQRAICAVYPPDRDAPACANPKQQSLPPHGFSLYCGGGSAGAADAQARGCAVGTTLHGARGRTSAALFAAIAGLLVVRRRRQRSSLPPRV